jgi:hypothetical protein
MSMDTPQPRYMQKMPTPQQVANAMLRNNSVGKETRQLLQITENVVDIMESTTAELSMHNHLFNMSMNNSKPSQMFH